MASSASGTPKHPGTVRVSVRADGTEANGDSFSPRISADGRFVAFASTATNLVPDSPAYGGLCLKDR
ncbi:hypothetical protein [Streptomyces sp. NPDC053079]|uniref:hypothetical protein n=1 Tax=Streptomyces sp. NPDC053079 TaxID=3365697 RepID=UPI0037CE2BDF